MPAPAERRIGAALLGLRKWVESTAVATVSIEFPEDVLSALRRSPAEFAREVRLAAAIHWYQQGRVSQERAAAIAGLDRTEFLTELAHRGIDVIHVDLDELRREAGRG